MSRRGKPRKKVQISKTKKTGRRKKNENKKKKKKRIKRTEQATWTKKSVTTPTKEAPCPFKKRKKRS